MIKTINLSYFILGILVTPLLLSLPVSFIFASFSLWRSLKDDYPEDQIFSLTLSLLVGTISFFLIGSLYHLPVLEAFIGGFISLFFWALATKKNVWEIYDSLARPIIYILLIMSIGLFLTTFNFWDLSYFGIGFAGLILHLILKSKYRSLSWYKSGKPGLLFWMEIAFVFLIFFILAFLKPSALYWESWLYLPVVIISIAAIYIRSERKIKEDLKFLTKLK